MPTKRLFTSLILGLGLARALLGLLTGGSVTVVYADTYTVTHTHDAGAGSLRQAIIDANGNTGHDIINFSVNGTIVLTDALPTIDDDLTISGPGAEALAVSGDNAHRVLKIDSGVAVTITGLTVRDGSDTNGGGILSEGTLHLDSVRIVSNTAMGAYPNGDGGGVHVYAGSATLNDTRVVSNAADGDGGGVYVFAGSVTLRDTQVISNAAQWGGGVFVDEGSATLSGTQVTGNATPDHDGGGVFVYRESATLHVSGGKISGNDGGGVLVVAGSATLSGAQVVSNTAPYGGGVHVSTGNATLTETRVVSNAAANHGGGAYVDESSATLRVSGGEIGGNSTSGDGGGVYVDEGRATLTGAQMIGNAASDHDGGGVYVSRGRATLSDTQVISNAARRGAGVFLDAGSATLTGAQVTGNMAVNHGGGVYVDQGRATLHVSGSEISDNATASYSGGGLFVGQGSATLTGTHVVGNSAADQGGGVFVAYGTATLTGTHLIRNTASADGGGLFLHSSTGAVTATDGCVVYNSDTAVENRSGGTLNTSDNWWGAPDGPSGDGPGCGDSIRNVSYTPFKTVPPAGCPTLPTLYLPLVLNAKGE